MRKARVYGAALIAVVAAALAIAPALSIPIQALGATVTVPRNSNNALAGAIAAAGPGGTVLLAPGYHYESGTVLITQTVTILGQRGASLISTTTPGVSYPLPIEAALHIRGASGVTIKGLEIRPRGEGDGNTGILIENATDALVEANFIRRYQFGVLIQEGDRATINRNTIAVSGLWQSGAVPEAHGIVNINGVGVILRDNRVSNALFGIWACDRSGQAFGNTLSGSFIGLILCKVPPGTYDISGSAVGADETGNGWHVYNNFAASNQWGYLIIDGAYENTVNNNAASGNVVYDMEFTADTFRFGFLTPAAHDNTASIGAFRDMKVKDCGVNNTISGGTQIDITQDPCF